jgi:diacylglycerol kinase family enzyme
MKLTLGRKVLEDDVYLVSIGNGWNVGGGLQLTPKAIMDDGKFDVCYIKEITRRRVITNFSKLTKGTITEIDEVEIYQAKSIKVESSVDIPFHFDGEIFPEKMRKLDIKLTPSVQPIIGNWQGDKRFD